MNKKQKTFDKPQSDNSYLGIVSGSTSFKEKMINNFIPRVEKMVEKEKAHLQFLIDNKAPTEFIQMSQKNHFYLLDKIKEYKKYVDSL